MASKIRDVMTKNVATLPGSASLRTAAKEMRDRDIGGVIVLKSDNSLCGMVTDRDIVVRALADGKDPSECKLDEICSREVTTIQASDDIEKGVQLMREKAVRRLPVQDNGKIVGIVSLGDLAIDRDRRSALGEISAAPANH